MNSVLNHVTCENSNCPRKAVVPKIWDILKPTLNFSVFCSYTVDYKQIRLHSYTVDYKQIRLHSYTVDYKQIRLHSYTVDYKLACFHVA